MFYQCLGLLAILVQDFIIFNAAAEGAASSKKFADRNVLLIVADDAGFENSAYGNTVIHTPAIQWLADNGVIFLRAFTAVSSCSASRSVIMTGLPPHQSGMYGLHHNYHNFNCFDTVKSMPNIIAKHGFRTGIIGKKHVGPSSVFNFNFSETEENNPTNLVGRNITHMAMLVRRFLDKNQTSHSKFDQSNRSKLDQSAQSKSDPFFLYVAFHDPHRCGHTEPELGEFCENYGNGIPGMGLIPDWKPIYYDPKDVKVPYFIPNTPAARADLAAEYTAVNRMDQGISLIIEELKVRGLLDNTLIIFTSDNGLPFPSGRTNFYDPGMGEPFIVFPPYNVPGGLRSHKEADSLVSLLDIVPTILDWFQIPYPKYKIFSGQQKVQLLGKSVMPLVVDNWKTKRNNRIPSAHYLKYRRLRKKRQEYDKVFCSHNLHEVTMYYPMRVVRNRRFKLIHNLNYGMPFPIDQDFFISSTFQDLLNRTRQGLETHFYKNLTDYYYRHQWELYDLEHDSEELRNLASEQVYKPVLNTLKNKLNKWMNKTNDPWICSPSGVLEDRGRYKLNPSCLSADNGT